MATVAHVLDQKFKLLLSSLQLDDFVDCYRGTVLSDSDIEKLCSNYLTRRDKIIYLVQVVKEKDPQLEHFVPALKESDSRYGLHNDLITTIESIAMTRKENYGSRRESRSFDDVPSTRMTSSCKNFKVCGSLEIHLGSNSSLVGYQTCMIIASHGDKYPVKLCAVPKEKPDSEFLPGVQGDVICFQSLVHGDKHKELVLSLVDFPGVQRSTQFYLGHIENMFNHCSKDGVLLYYTGHGEFETGNWCFSDGKISFQNIADLYMRHLKGKILTICTDCSYSGQWVTECADFLDRSGIAACGHQARKRGILIKVYASCLPTQKARDMCYSHKGVMLDNTSCMVFCINNKLTDTQTAYGCDFTKTMCWQLEGPDGDCRIHDVPYKCRWKWYDCVHDSNPFTLLQLVRGKDRGREAWHYVLIEKDLKNSFLERVRSGTFDCAEFGFVIKSGWGQDPPDSVKKAMGWFGPRYFSSSL